MGGVKQLELSRDVARRALICLASSDLDKALSGELIEAGFSTESQADLCELPSALSDGGITVLVVDDSQLGWLRVIADVVQARPDVQPVVLADIDNPDEFLAAVMAGVGGFCRTDSSVQAIVRTIESVCASGVAIPRDMVGPLVAHVRRGRGHRVNTAAGPVDVTDREWEIMQLMIQRRSTREIADALYVSAGTVRSHMSALMHKVGAVDRDDLVAMVDTPSATVEQDQRSTPVMTRRRDRNLPDRVCSAKRTRQKEAWAGITQ